MIACSDLYQYIREKQIPVTANKQANRLTFLLLSDRHHLRSRTRLDCLTEKKKYQADALVNYADRR